MTEEKIPVEDFFPVFTGHEMTEAKVIRRLGEKVWLEHWMANAGTLGAELKGEDLKRVLK